jgi:hypothetical protein
MGTSASFRAPNTPRWQAFAIALQSGQPLERLQSELFNAGADWERELGAPAVAAYAVALLEAHAGLADRLRAAERPEQALQATIAEARAASEALPGSAAGALAERAFLSLLTRVASGSQALADAAPAQAAEQFASARGTPSELIAGYVGELLGQYARHVTAREAGRLTEGEAGIGVAATRRLTRSLAGAAERVGREARPAADAAALRQSWQPLITEAFSRGRRLPEHGR